MSFIVIEVFSLDMMLCFSVKAMLAGGGRACPILPGSILLSAKVVQISETGKPQGRAMPRLRQKARLLSGVCKITHRLAMLVLPPYII
jgi:hypothetical protein